jgi:DNA repair protein RecO
MSEIRVNGIVIRVNQARESDLIVKIVTAELGKVSTIAKAARKSKRRFSSGLDLFDHGQFTLTQTKRSGSELLIIKDFVALGAFKNLRSDLDKLGAASCLAESYDLLLAERIDNDTECYNNLSNGLQAIEHASSLNEILRYCFISLSNFLSLSGLLDDSKGKKPSARALAQLLNQIEHCAGRKLYTRESIERSIVKLVNDTRNQSHNQNHQPS